MHTRAKYSMSLKGEEYQSLVLNEIPLDAEKLIFDGFFGKSYKVHELPDSLKSFKQLKYLEFNECPISELPAWVGELKSLVSLKFSSCRLSGFNGISELNRLQSFHIHQNNFDADELCEEISKSSVKDLVLRNDKLIEIPSSLWKCSQLSSLFLASLGIKNLDGPFEKLKHIKRLELGAKIKSLPSSIGRLDNLEELVLRFSKLKSIPPSLCKLKKLRKLEIDHANISSIPDDFDQLKQMEHLSLAGNKIKNFSGDYSGWKNLKSINLRANALETWPKGLEQLSALKNVELDCNYHPESGIDLMKVWLNTIGNLPDDIFIGNRVPLENEFKNANPKKLYLRYDWMYYQEHPKVDHRVLPWVCTLNNLEELELAMRLEIVPEEIGKLQKLKKLTITSETKFSLPKCLSKMVRMEQIQVKSLKDTVIDWTLLSNLRAASITVGKVEKLWLPNSLKRLYLSAGHLPEDTFHEKLELEELNVSSWYDLPSSISKLQNLKVIDIRADYPFSLKSFFSNISKLPDLTKFKLSMYGYPDNMELPSELNNCKSLTRLTLNVRPSQVPSLESLSKLTFIMVEGEAVRSEEKKSFKIRLPNQGKGWKQEFHTKGHDGRLGYRREL